MYRVNLAKAEFAAQHDEPLLTIPIGTMLRQVAFAQPKHEALVEVLEDGSLGRRWTYTQLLDDSQRLAHALASRFAKGEKLVVWSPNSPEWVLMEYACAFAGLILVTANPSLQPKELRYVLEQSGAVALFYVQGFRGNPMADIADAALQGNETVRERVDMADAGSLFAHDKPVGELPEVIFSDPAQIQYTSGTTGFPKAAILSQGGLLNNARFYARRCGVTAASRWINMMPMFHTSGCGMVTLGAMQAGACMILTSRFDAEQVVDLIESQKASIILGVPTMILALLEAQEAKPRNVKSLKLISGGGSNVAAELISRVRTVFDCGFSTLYGQTEYCPVITQHHLSDGLEDIAHTIGQPIPQTAVSIRRLDNNLCADIAEQGEICVKGPCTMLGYHGDETATAAAIDQEGWLHTGDLGVMDKRGYVQITGRVKEMIIRGGENHFPAEIENAVLTNKSVAEVAVVGIPDEKWGEVIACFIRSVDDRPLDVDDLKAHCRQELSPQKTPNIWVHVKDFPMTGSRKIQKFALRDAFVAGEFKALPF